MQLKSFARRRKKKLKQFAKCRKQHRARLKEFPESLDYHSEWAPEGDKLKPQRSLCTVGWALGNHAGLHRYALRLRRGLTESESEGFRAINFIVILHHNSGQLFSILSFFALLAHPFNASANNWPVSMSSLLS